MKKLASSVFLACILVFALSQATTALTWPSAEIRASCPWLIQKRLDDQTIAYYGCGEKTGSFEKNSEGATRNQEREETLRLKFINIWNGHFDANNLTPEERSQNSYRHRGVGRNLVRRTRV